MSDNSACIEVLSDLWREHVAPRKPDAQFNTSCIANHSRDEDAYAASLMYYYADSAANVYMEYESRITFILDDYDRHYWEKVRVDGATVHARVD